ncbi:MAG: ADP-ribosylglycohydrolase family protein [Actinomycetales bacterium]
MTGQPPAQRDRALGALTGLALGDALGMPTQMMPRAEVRRRWGVLPGLVAAPQDNEVSAGLPAGHVTDDTDQAVILGRLLVAGEGRVDPVALAARLLEWEAGMVARGSADLLGPSTRRALEQVTAGAPPGTTGRWGDTDGAAMRIAPVGVACPPEPLARLVDLVAEAGRLTHDTTVANAGAAAVAAAVSAGVAGATVPEAIEAGVAAARVGATRGHYVPGADVAERIAWAVALVGTAADPLDTVARLVGTGVATQEAVPAAFAVLALHPADPWQACLAAAELGGDSDTVAALAGAIGGACHGRAALPADAVALVHAVNPGLGLAELADGLLGLRTGYAAGGS